MMVNLWCSFGSVLVQFWWSFGICDDVSSNISILCKFMKYGLWNYMKIVFFLPQIWCIFAGTWKCTKSAPKVHQNMVQFWCSFGAVSNYHINLSKFQQHLSKFNKQFQNLSKVHQNMVQFWCSFGTVFGAVSIYSMGVNPGSKKKE